MVSSITQQRYLNFTCVFLNCLTAGSVFTFALFSPPFARSLHLSIFHLQCIVSSAIFAQYISGFIWGSLIDKRGPAIASRWAAILYAVGYGMLGWRYLVSVELEKGGIVVLKDSNQWMFLSFYYSLVGSAVGASYFSAIIASTKSLPAKHSGLAIGVPLAIFGLSPLFLSFLASFFTSVTTTLEGTNDVDPGRYLLFLGIFLALVNAISGFGLKVIPWEEAEVTGGAVKLYDEDETHSPPSRHHTEIDSGFVPSRSSSPSESTPLILPSSSSNSTEVIPENKSQSIKEFISQPSFWLFGSVLVLSIGPTEMTFASLGSIIESLLGVRTAGGGEGGESTALLLRQQHVRVISITNTLSRLLIGVVSDRLSISSSSSSSTIPGARKGVSRLLFLFLACTALALSFTYVALFLDQAKGLYVLSISTGISYGTIFTLSPSIVRTVYPVEDFGRNWGLLSWFSALGALLFTPLFGLLGDRAAESQNSPICYGRECFENVFLLSAFSCAVGMGLVAGLWWKFWRGKV